MRIRSESWLWLWVALATAVIGCDSDAGDTPETPETPQAPKATPAPQAAEPPGTAETELSDADITRAVKRELRQDGAVPQHELEVLTQLGVVQLTGTVRNLIAKERATRLASVVKGVRAVSNRIQVDAKERPDAEIRRDIENALLFDPAAESFDIEVSVEDQVATLSGKVQSWQEKMVAERVAKGVSGVEAVDDRIQLQYDPNRSDADIEADVRARLRWDALVDDGLIVVSVRDGIVHLSGTVGSLAERQRAWGDAWIAGVRGVDHDALQVAWWAKEPDLRRGKYTARSDADIQRAIKDAMLVDPRVNSFAIEPRVEAGSITLTGTVTNPKAKHAAEALAKNTTGVVTVKNEIQVAPTQPIGEAALKRRVEDALLRNPITEAYEIGVAVQDGVVTLTGKVDSYAEKAEAEDVAATLAGVTRVDNRIAVEKTIAFVYETHAYPFYPYIGAWTEYRPARAAKSDSELLDDIGDELFWSPFVDRDQIQIEVKDGVATLTGKVDSWHERNSAVENAFEGGAIAVTDRLEVQ